MKKTCCLIILVSLVLTSCAQNQYGENSSPMLGVGIGAIGGAILGQALGEIPLQLSSAAQWARLPDMPSPCIQNRKPIKSRMPGEPAKWFLQHKEINLC